MEPVDYFYVGDEAFQKGKRECDMPSTLTNDEQHFWLGGFRSAARRAENPCISVEEYHRIADSAYSAYMDSSSLASTKGHGGYVDCERIFGLVKDA